MTEYYLPYQFIPVTGEINGESSQTLPWTQVADPSQAQPCRHDLWQANTRSGRLICKIRLESPTLVGIEQFKKPRQPTVVNQYTRFGKAALPANSLRGMIGSLAEALSQSSLRVLGEPFKQFFPENLHPWHSARRTLTWAERLFGVVGTGGQPNPDASRNLASRLRFADALPVGIPIYIPPLDEDIVLRALESPKPTNDQITIKIKAGLEGIGKWPPKSESTYFHIADPTTPVLRHEIDATKHIPNGRKKYLMGETYPSYEYSHPKMKTPDDKCLKGRLLSARQAFYFHIDFENLADEELTLLLAALQPALFPDFACLDDTNFFHHIGLGKAMGLGQVSLQVQTLHFIDRTQRYGSGGLTKEKYAETFFPSGASTAFDWEDELERYSPTEMTAVKKTRENNNHQATGLPDALLDEATLCKVIDRETLRTILTLGDRQYLESGVTIRTRERKPKNKNEAASEHEYEQAEALKPITPGEIIPPFGEK